MGITAHTFQPLDINDTEFNPFKLIGTDWAALTTEVDGKADTMTVSWGGVGVMFGKNVVFIFIRDSRYTRELLDKGSSFSLSFFNPDMKEYKSAMKYLGAVSGRDEDKFVGSRLHLRHSMQVPYIDEANFVILCRNLNVKVPIAIDSLPDELQKRWYSAANEGNKHNIYMGEITGLLAR